MMFSKLIQAAAVAATASAGTMMPRQDDHGWNFAPTLEPFITMSLSVYWPANITTPWGLIGGSNTCLGGTVKGAFEAEILPYGTAFERVIVSESAGENSVRSTQPTNLHAACIEMREKIGYHESRTRTANIHP